MPNQQDRTQPWRVFWTPTSIPEKAGQEIPQTVFEKGQTVIISDNGGFTPKTYTQLYTAKAAPNTTKVNGEVHIKKDESGKCFAEFSQGAQVILSKKR